MCWITHKQLYRALDIPLVRYRRYADPRVLFRRLLSLDYVIEHPDFEWLPTESEKLRYCEALAVERGRLPQRIYHGSVGGAVRYFPIKLPLSGGRPAAFMYTTFVYIDPGNEPDTELRYWGEQHEALWTGLRQQGIPVHVVGIAAGREGRRPHRHRPEPLGAGAGSGGRRWVG